jgi:glutathione S-transferase
VIKIFTTTFPTPHSWGLIRDIRIRWALEEVGQDYEVEYVDRFSPEYRSKQPFGQVPAVEIDGLSLFETAAIILHIGDLYEGLLPRDKEARARAVMWVIAGASTMEPTIDNLCRIDLFSPAPELERPMRPINEMAVKRRLSELATALGDRDYLEDDFTAGDLAMSSALNLLRHTSLVSAEPTLSAYLARCHARPAYQRALADHMEVFQKMGQET